MSQHDYNIANQSRTSFRSDLNSLAAAILSGNSGTTAPTTTTPYMFWADTTNNLLKQRNAADSGWIVRDTLDETFLLARSSNTILGDPSGHVTSLEYGPSGAAALKPDFGIVTHTNHFCDPDLKAWQAPLTQMLTSEPRLACAERHVSRWPDLIVDSHLMNLLRDESGDGSSGDAKFGAICRHPDPAAPAELRVESVFGVIIDCNARRMRVAAGLPSKVEFEAFAL